MILGTGCDLVEIERMKKACEKEAFLSRVYTERERRQAGGKASVLVYISNTMEYDMAFAVGEGE